MKFYVIYSCSWWGLIIGSFFLVQQASADLFDLYELAEVRDKLPLEIQQAIAQHCLALFTIIHPQLMSTFYPSYVHKGVEFIDSQRIAVLCDHQALAYSLYKNYTHWELDTRVYSPFLVTPYIEPLFYEHNLTQDSQEYIVISTPRSYMQPGDFLHCYADGQHKENFLQQVLLSNKNNKWSLYKLIYYKQMHNSLELDTFSNNTGYKLQAFDSNSLSSRAHIAAIDKNNPTRVTIWKLIEHRWVYLTELEHESNAYAASFTDDYTKLAVACKSGKLYIWQLPLFIQQQACLNISLEQVLFIKLISTVYNEHKSCSFRRMAQLKSLAKNLSDTSTQSVIDYLTAVLNSFDSFTRAQLERCFGLEKSTDTVFVKKLAQTLKQKISKVFN